MPIGFFGAQFTGDADTLDGLDSTAFVRTGSNLFIGDQHVSGILYVSRNVEAVGFTGSLTQIDGGLPYLLAGPNITLTTNSLGQIEITGSGGSGGGGSVTNPGGLNQQIQYNNNGVFAGTNQITFDGIQLFATGSFKGSLQGTSSYSLESDLLDGLNSTDFAILNNSNTFNSNNIFTSISASIGISSSGDVYIGGKLISPSISGSLTTLIDGSSYLLAGNNVTIVTNSNGSITINSTAQSGNDSYWISNVRNLIKTTGSIEVTGSLSVTNTVYVKNGFYSSGSSEISEIITTGNEAITIKPYGAYGGNTGEIRFKELPGNGTNYVGFKAPDGVSNSFCLILPTADGASGNVLKTDGSKKLSFYDVSSLVTGSISVVKLIASSGISGSLTQLHNGSPYIIAGDNITLVTNSLGQIEISSSAGGSSNQYWKSDVNEISYTTGSIEITGSIISKGNSYSNGTLIAQVFENPDTTGNSYGTVIKAPTTNNGSAFLSFVNGNNISSDYVGGVIGWNKSTSFSLEKGLNITVPAGKITNFRFGSYPTYYTPLKLTDSVVQITGTLDITNGINVLAGGIKTAGSINDGGFKASMFIDDSVTDGTSYGAIFRNGSGNYATAGFSIIQDSTYVGGVAGLKNTPAGSTYGLMSGLNISTEKDKNINFRAINLTGNSYSFGNINKYGLQITGSIYSTTGFSGSLTTLLDGSPYLIAGNNITLSTSSNGSVTINSTANIPGGSDKQIQFNNAGIFDGVPNLTWDGTTLNATGSFSGSFTGTLVGTASLSTYAVQLITTTFNFPLNGFANGVNTNVGGIYIPIGMTLTTKSLAYIGGSSATETATLDLVPINSTTVSASWTRTNVLGSVALASSAYLGAGWYDIVLKTNNTAQNAFARGLYLTSGDY